MEGDGMFHSLPNSLPNNNHLFLPDTSVKQHDRSLNYNKAREYVQEPFHSTPKPKSKSSPSTTSHKMSSMSFPGAHASWSPSSMPTVGHNRTSPAAKGVQSSPVVGSSNSIARPIQSYNSSPNKNFVSELEANTIQKQRRELQLLICELQDRDRELNEMVASHQKQLLAWEQDRQKLLTLEQRYTRVQGELGNRTDQMRTLTTRIKVLESQEQSKTCAIESAQKQLQEMAEKVSSSNMQIRELHEHNNHLNSVTRDLSTKIGNLEAREQELLTMLKLKDKDLAEASSHLADVAGKIKRLDQANKELKQSESKARKELADFKQKHSEAKAETDKLREELSDRHNTTTEQNIELGRLREQVMALKRELVLAGEQEKRKNQLIELQKSKQERTDSELTNLRQIYERQQRDLSLLQLNYDSTQDNIRRTKFNSTVAKDGYISSDTDSPSPVKSDPPSSPLSDHPTNDISDQVHHMDGPVVQHQHGSGTEDSNGSGDTDDLLRMSQQGEASPTSKLHRLLTESRQMVKNLEQTAVPPFVHSPPIKQNGSFHNGGHADNN